MSVMALHLGIKSTTEKNKINATQLSFVLCGRGDSIE